MKTPVLFSLSLLLVLAGCGTPQTSSPYQDPMERGMASRGVDIYDYQLVVETMVRSMLRDGLRTEDGRVPVITLGPIYNHTPYNVEVRMIGEDIRIEMLKSRLARFSTATDFERQGGESGHLYKQLAFQNESGMVNPDTAKRYGNLVGADYILFGNIYSFERRGGGMTEANFRFNLTLTEVETGLAVWADTKPIRKLLD